MQTLNILFGLRARVIRSLFLLAMAMGLIACSGESTTVEGDVSVAYVKRPVDSLGNPTDAVEFTEGGDLYMREKSSPSAPETNLTGSLTNGRGDVSDPEVSYDGTKILFAMRCVTGASNSCLNPDGSGNDSNWRIWEYNILQKSFTRIRCTAASGTAPPGDDVDPAYLPDGRIVFVSNRQVKSQQANGFAYLDEYERERTTTLHVMDSNGQNCRQISYNQSHDRNPTVLQSGEIMYSRWDHVGERNQFSIFFTNPDGTNLFVFYGAHSPGNSYLHPREMPNGQVLSSLMPLSGTHEGGALMSIDIRNYSENCEPQSGAANDCNGQRQPTARQINFGMGISQYGRYSTPYPLWDGTNRALVSWAPSCSATNSCATVANPLTGVQEVSEEESTPVYGVYMLDLNTGTTRPVVPATVGANGQPTHSVLDPVAIQPRPRPNVIADKDLTGNRDGSGRPLHSKTSTIGTIGVGTLSVKSVYDTDSLERMGNAVLVNGESIPFVTSASAPPAPELCDGIQPDLPTDSPEFCRCKGRPRIGTPDLCALKNPTVTHAGQRPARFVRVTRAIPTEGAISRDVIGETDFEMQQILGYAPIEPDGSFKIEVPADIPVALTVTDAAGRGFTPHTSWIQVRPGETRTCNGCHSPRRGSSLNPPGIAGNHAYSLMPATGSGQSMAETRVAASPSASVLNPNMIFTDVWTDTTEPDVVAAVPATRPTLADPDIRIEYTSATVPAVPMNGVIDYADHIQPLWEKNLPTGNTCITCHNNNDSTDTNSRGLDLRSGTQTGSGRLPSYDELLIGDPILEGNPPRPRLIQNENALVVARGEAQVIPGASRASHLMEVLFRQELKSALPLVSTIDHSGMLNAAEKRLIAEWIDIGAQYYNSPRDSSNQPRAVTGLTQNSFRTLDPTDRDVHAALLDRCGTCHRAFGQTGTPNATFVGRRFVLTGAAEGDFNATLSMLRDVGNPPLNDLLRRPASTGTNPTHATSPGGGAILPAGDSDYRLICNWIRPNSCP